MMPVYRYMDSYPDRGNQISSGHNFYPSFEAVPTLAKVDPSKPVVINQPWLYPNSFNHSIPCYPCSNDGHFPGYYGHGFYPHSPTPQFNCCGHHPPFPGAFPVQYVPPSYYLKELPNYDYDKPKDNGYHCCGCPNHSHNQKHSGGERMEEEEPNAGSKLGHSKVPFQLENYPYPVLWIPPEYMKNKEHKKSLESDGVTPGKSLQDMKPPQNVKPNEHEPKERRSWFPLDMKSLQSLLQGDDGRKTRDQQDEGKMKQFPFPIFWMPPHQKQKEDEKEEQGHMNGSPTIVKDPVPGNNVLPVKLLNDGHDMSKARYVHEDVSDQVNSELREKSSNQRIIPVKQMEEKSTNQRSIPVKQMEEKNTKSIPVKLVEVFKEGENAEGAERRGRAVSPEKRDHESGKASGAGARRASSSPPKSKLPPVCLRVDPLPRKKSSSLSSRSPSPPGSTGKSQERTKEALNLPVISDHKARTCQDSEVIDNTLRSNKEAEEKKSEGEAIQVVERKRDENKDEKRRNGSEIEIPVCSSIDSSNQTIQQCEKNNVKSITEGEKGLESADGSTTKQAHEKQETNDESRCVDVAIDGDEKKLSVDEAASCIQSAYRGYQVRRWEPLKKLKQIAEVQEQMIELKKKIHGLESSLDLQKDEKQIAVIGEMIMRLLLKLDTIQGLHPNLRNVRKSLARELVMLQEKLDLLVKANCNAKPSDSEGGESRAAREHATGDIRVNAVSDNQAEESSKSSLLLKDEQRETINDVQLAARDVQFPLNDLKGEVDDRDSESIMVLDQDQEGNEKTSQLLPEKSGSEEVSGAQLESICYDMDNERQPKLSYENGSLHLDINSQVPKLEDPELVISEDLVASVEEKEIDPNIGEPISSTKVDEPDTAAQVIEMLNELPVGVIENEEPLQHEQAGLTENVKLLDGDVGANGVIDRPEWQFTKDTSSELEEDSDLKVAKQQGMLVVDPKPTGTYTSPVDMEIPNQKDSEQQSIEGFDEVNPESIQPMTVGIEDNNFSGKALLGGDQQQTQESEMQKEGDQGMINVDVSSISEAKNAIVSNAEEAEAEDGQNDVYQPTRELVNEGILQEQGESHEQETANVTDMSSYQLDRPDTPIEEAKRESSPSSTATGDLSTQEQEIALEDGKKLVEENEKMREMVEKLVECGREQLASISYLTERVNDLEKKLRRKKMKTRQAVSSPSPRKKAVSGAS